MLNLALLKGGPAEIQGSCMLITVIAQCMAFGHDALHQCRILLAVPADAVEGGARVEFLQGIQNLRCHFRIRAIVEGQGDLPALARTMGNRGHQHR